MVFTGNWLYSPKNHVNSILKSMSRPNFYDKIGNPVISADKPKPLFPLKYQNQNWYSSDTIAAIATPEGKGGIGIIRISGNQALTIIKNIFRKSRHSDNESPEIISHKIYYGLIFDPKNGEKIDEVIILPMMTPRSYTREDVIEIQAHSGIAVMGKILQIILDQGARLAEPGEFTKRAFLNGRIDLTQAEAILDIINAENENARKLATRQLSGDLRKQLIHIQNKLVDSLAEIEAEIDFSEEQGDVFLESEFWREDILLPMVGLNESAHIGQIFREGMSLVLAGKPNVGKSSLMNRLLNQERAIVTCFPGTTRDHIDEGFEIEGIKVRLTDTAGIHESRNPIEVLGINKTKEIIQQANVVLFICDLSKTITEEDNDIFDLIQDKKKIIVFNKKDLVGERHVQKVPLKWEKETQISISVLKNEGINELKKMIADQVLENGRVETESLLVSTLRQKTHIEKAAMAVQNAIQCHESGLPMEIIAIEFKEALYQINSALGDEVSEDILERIFQNFCIGK